SKERSFRIDLEDLREDHAAEVSGLNEKIANLEKEVRAAKKRKAYVETVANKKIAQKDAGIAARDRQIEGKDFELCYQTGLYEAAFSELEEKEQALQLSNSKASTLKQQLAYWIRLYTEIRNDRIANQHWVIEPLQQEVARLTAQNCDFVWTMSAQSSQINYLYDTHAQVQQRHAELLSVLAKTCEERDQFKADLQHCTDNYEQTLGDLITARKEISAKDDRFKAFNCEHEDNVHPAEAAHLLELSQEQCRGLEKMANECSSREQQTWKKLDLERDAWELKAKYMQKTIDNLEGKVAVIETSNERLVDLMEQRIEEPIVQNPLQRLYEESKQTVGDLKIHISHQNAQIAHQQREIHQHEVTISLRDRSMQDKDSELSSLCEAKADAERQVEEIQCKSDEREIHFNEEFEQAVNDIDYFKTRMEEYQTQIQTMTNNGVAAT
ncbi:MAG: hypothetical protein Q9224_007122, partial [Gallowayella concinna]